MHDTPSHGRDGWERTIGELEEDATATGRRRLGVRAHVRVETGGVCRRPRPRHQAGCQGLARRRGQAGRGRRASSAVNDPPLQSSLARAAERRGTSRRVAGVLVTHETMTFAGEPAAEPDTKLETIEVVEAGGEGDYAGEAAYAIFESRSGRFGYAVTVDQEERLAWPDCTEHGSASREAPCRTSPTSCSPSSPSPGTATRT